jgi:NAD+ diphosphatase
MAVDAVNLPFNATILKDHFLPALPGSSPPDDQGFWVIIRGGEIVVKEEGGSLVLPYGPFPLSKEALKREVYLGLWQGKPLRAALVGKETELSSPLVPEPFNFTVERLDDKLLTLGGIAQHIFHWQRLSNVCSFCGSAMEDIAGTWGKKCLSCKHEHFPHIHPCAIILVRKGDEFLLTRKPGWPEGRYGLVAGFLDIGESLEECAAREVLEETGIRIKNIRYVGSQNWPFPSQLMAGFVADYAGGEIVVDGVELEDARWFTAEQWPCALPGKRSIARWIIDTYALNES